MWGAAAAAFDNYAIAIGLGNACGQAVEISDHILLEAARAAGLELACPVFIVVPWCM